MKFDQADGIRLDDVMRTRGTSSMLPDWLVRLSGMGTNCLFLRSSIITAPAT